MFLFTNIHAAEPRFVQDLLPDTTFTGQHRDCLINNLYFEARNQTPIGQLAVGFVTLNRVASGKFPDSICSVVWQTRRSNSSGRIVAQFSWTLDGKSDKPKKSSEAYKLAVSLAEILLHRDNGVYDFTDGATHYHATYVNPVWSKDLTKLAQYDDHIFYIE